MTPQELSGHQEDPAGSFAINPMFQAAAGNTAGKAIFGLKVRSIDQNENLAFYLKREFFVWLEGFALGIPVASLVTYIIQFLRIRKGKSASYDRDGTFVVGRPSDRRIIIGFVIGMAIVSAINAAEGAVIIHAAARPHLQLIQVRTT